MTLTFSDYHKLLIKKTMLVLLLIFLVVLGFLMSEVIHKSDDDFKSKQETFRAQRYGGNVSIILDPYTLGYNKGYEQGFDAGKQNATLWMIDNGGANNQEIIDCVENKRRDI